MMALLVISCDIDCTFELVVDGSAGVLAAALAATWRIKRDSGP